VKKAVENAESRSGGKGGQKLRKKQKRSREGEKIKGVKKSDFETRKGGRKQKY
jgi:hypothetical protein